MVRQADMHEVTLIIVNWNGRQYLQDCLDSVLDQTYTDFEVIVVDNGSSDDSVCFIRENYPQVKIVCLDENLGFTGGNIAGFEVAQGQFIALLNNDTRVEQDWLGELVNAMRARSDLGICASKIVIDGTNLIDSAGDCFTTAFTGTKIGYKQPASLFGEPRSVHGGCAAAILYRRSMLEQIGFLDDDFFFNHEDTDLNIRAWLAGWKCAFVPQAVVHHKVSGSIGHLSARTVYFFSRNNEWVWLKNIPLTLMVRLLPARILYELFAFLYYGILSGQLGAFLRGKIDAIKNIRRVLAKRKDIQRLVVISQGEMLRHLEPISGYLINRVKNG